MRSTQSTYDTDVVAWAREQAKLLRAGRFDAIDIEQTGIGFDRLPADCPWSADQVRDPDFWPTEPANP